MEHWWSDTEGWRLQYPVNSLNGRDRVHEKVTLTALRMNPRLRGEGPVTCSRRHIFSSVIDFACEGNAVDFSWNVMAHGDAREGKWSGNWRIELYPVPFTLPRNMVYQALLPLMRSPRLQSSRLNWRPRRFKWTRPFRRKTKFDFCACAITFQLAST